MVAFITKPRCSRLGGTEPKARVTYVANWHDGLGRVVASADYGTNGGTALTRPATVPASSDTVLVSTTSFDAAGEVATTTDPAGMVTKYEFDDAGRQTKLIENYQSSSSSSSSSAGTGCPNSDDVNRTTVTTYTPDGDVATLVAWNATTGNQTTTYTYGTTLADSDIATSNLLRQVAYPDSTGGGDVVQIAYNRQGERKSVTDQNGTVHQYDFDLLGRLIHDRTTALGSGVDASVQRISFTYEVRGMINRITSYDNPAVGVGNVVNEVALSYNDFGQLVTDQQSHGGAVVSSTPKVQYAYADGSAGTVRATGLTYPNGRTLSFDYGATGSIDDAAGRIAGIKQGTTTLAGYGEYHHDRPVASPGRRVPYPATAFDCHYDPSRLRPPVSCLSSDITESVGPAWVTPAYDPAGNMTTIPKPADPTQGFTAVYDAWNRLVKLSDSSGTVQENQYDGRNFRVVRKDYSGGMLTETRHFYYTSAWQVLEERVDSSTSPNRQFVWGLRYIDDCILRDRDTSGDGVLDERLYALQDGNWNVTAVCDESGDVQERYAYTAYGEPVFLSAGFVEQSGSSFGWEVLFTGQRWDGGSGLFLLRHRVWNSSIGKWHQRDPAGYQDSLNAYAYLDSNPLNGTDSLGLGKGRIVGWVVRRVGSKLIKVRVVLTHKQAARLFASGYEVVVVGGRKEALKVARILVGKSSVGKKNILRGGEHAAGHWLRRHGVRGWPHIQLDDIPNRHIFYGIMGFVLSTVTSEAARAGGCPSDYDLDVAAVYTNPRAGETIFKAWTFSYWAGDNSALSYLDWVNPLELAVLGAEAGRWLDRQLEKELVGITLTLSKKNGPPIRSYTFDPQGQLVSVAYWQDGSIHDRYTAQQYFRFIRTGDIKDRVFESLSQWVAKQATKSGFHIP